MSEERQCSEKSHERAMKTRKSRKRKRHVFYIPHENITKTVKYIRVYTHIHMESSSDNICSARENEKAFGQTNRESIDFGILRLFMANFHARVEMSKGYEFEFCGLYMYIYICICIFRFDGKSRYANVSI